MKKLKRFGTSMMCVLLGGFMVLTLISTFIIGFKIIKLLIHGILNVAMIGEFAIALSLFAICFGLMEVLTDGEGIKLTTSENVTNTLFEKDE